MANTTADNWDITAPANADPVKDGAREVRVLREGAANRLKKEHVAPANGNIGGEHKMGSAIVYRQTAAPTVRPDAATVFTAADEGRIWIDDTGLLKYLKSDQTWSGIFSSNVINASISYSKLAADMTAGLGKETALPTDPNRPWLSLNGTARPFYGNYNGGYPTTRPDGAALVDDDAGRLAVNWNNSNILKHYAGTALGWLDVTTVPVDNSVTLAKLAAAVTNLLNVRVAKANYVGNGTVTRAVTGLGFQPDILLIVNLATGSLGIASQTFGNVIAVPGAGMIAATALTLDADGFTIKTANAAVNSNGVTYGYIALRVNA